VYYLGPSKTFWDEPNLLDKTTNFSSGKAEGRRE
jgi:hypothetical protein